MVNKIRLASGLLFILILFLACAEERFQSTKSPNSPQMLSDPQELKIITHDSFDIGKEIIKNFEIANNAKVIILKSGDAGKMVNRAILEKGNPSADLLYGVDNTLLTRTLREEIFLPYKSPLLEKVPKHLLMDNSFHVTPVDYGYVNINYDKEYLKSNKLIPPNSLEELVDPRWSNKLVVQNPATSSPGLAFLIATVSYFGEDDDYDYLDFWAALKSNGVLVKDGWSDAYYTNFSKNGGDRPLVVSYATSPAAEVFFSEGKYTDPPTGNLLVDHATFLQIEGIGILNGTKVINLAQRFVDYSLGKQFQEDIPNRMFVYPVNEDAETPDFFRFAQVPTKPADIAPETIDEKLDEWIDAWTNTVLR